MRLYQKSILILSLFLFTISGCSRPSQAVSKEMEEKFQDIVSITDMNRSLQLNANGEGTFPIGSRIQLRIQNQTPNQIFFAGDSHIKLFTIRNGEWSKVKNGLTYSGSILLSPRGTSLLDAHFTVVQPVLDENMMKTDQKDIPLRIVMIGEVLENDKPTGKLVGSYVDVYITP